MLDLLEIEWKALAELCADLSEEEWNLVTDCPGWSVRDNVSHLIGTERQLLGESPPQFDGGMPDWVKNPIGEMNEAWIAERRDRPGHEVLAEFEEVTARRLEQLREFSDEEWKADTPGPTGVVPYSEFMDIRVMDCWAHDQDIRRATGRPGNQTGPVADHSLARFIPGMGYVVGKLAAASDGQSVVFDLTGAQARTIAVEVVDGRARLVDATPAAPTVTLHMQAETWWRLALGRQDAETALAGDEVTIEGDSDLARRVLDNMTVMI